MSKISGSSLAEKASSPWEKAVLTPSRGGISLGEMSKVGKTLGTIGSKVSSSVQTIASSSGHHLLKTAASRTAVIGTTLGLSAFLSSILFVVSSVAAGYLTYRGIKELLPEKNDM